LVHERLREKQPYAPPKLLLVVEANDRLENLFGAMGRPYGKNSFRTFNGKWNRSLNVSASQMMPSNFEADRLVIFRVALFQEFGDSAV
jgi:hypothetical protein